jgi:DNA polymerase-1
LSADYSQVELRLLAHFSEDPTMLKSFQDNIDIHAQTASEVLDIPLTQVTSNDRAKAKAVNFGLMYGQSSFGLASALKISRTEAKQYIDKYFTRFNSIKTFLDTLKDKAEQTGYAETLYGRKRFLPDIHSQNRTIKAQAERMAINSPIQGTAADIIKLAMINIDKVMTEKNLKSKMLLQVHDELIFEVEEDELEAMKEIVRDGMENVVDLRVPLKVDMGIGINWYDLK